MDILGWLTGLLQWAAVWSAAFIPILFVLLRGWPLSRLWTGTWRLWRDESEERCGPFGFFYK